MDFKRVLKAPVEEKSIYHTIFLIFLLYCLLVFLLANFGMIDHKDFTQVITIFVGWIITLLLAVIHLRATQKENRKGRTEEVKKSLEIDAFRKINEALTGFSEVVTTVTTPYRTLPGSLRIYAMHNEALALASLQKFLNVDLPRQNITLWDGATPFILAIESHEIAVIKYDHLRKFIQFTLDDCHGVINKFREYIQSTRVEILLSEDGIKRLETECKHVEENLFNLTMYLFDYRIELMNELLGDVFQERVTRRQPLDTRFKTLVEIATKDNVKEEEKRRDETRVLKNSIK